MKQRAGKLRVTLLFLLALIVCATASAFIGINFGKKLTASAAFKTDSNGYTVIQDDKLIEGYFNISTSGSTTTLSGFSEKTFKMLGVEPYFAGSIPDTMKLKVVIPEGVTNIATQAFKKCFAIKELILPEGLKTFGQYALESMGVTELHIPSTVTSFDISVMRDTVLEKITVAEGNKYFTTDKGQGEEAEGTCLLNYAGTNLILCTSNMSEVPDGVTTIESYSLSNKNLKKITLSSTVKTIYSAFYMTGIEEVDLGENTNFQLNDNCLLDSTGKKLVTGLGETVNIPEGVTSISGYISSYAVKNVNLPSSLTSIAAEALRAPNLEKITITGDTLTIGTNTYTTDSYGNLIQTNSEGKKILFTGVVSGQIEDDIDIINNRAYFLRNVKSVTVPESVKEIGDYAFWDSGLEELSVHPDLEKIGNDIVAGSKYYYDAKNYDDGNVFYLGSYLLKVAQPLRGTYTVREGTTVIAGNSFGTQPYLKRVNIPDSVITIGNNAFAICSALTTAYIHSDSAVMSVADGVTSKLKSLGSGCFATNVALVVDNKATYDAFKATEDLVGSRLFKLGYEVTVTFKVGSDDPITMQKLAGLTFGYTYNEETGEWLNSGFSPNGYAIDYWRNDTPSASDNGTTSKIGSNTPVPTDGEEFTFTAMKDESSGEVLEEVNALAKPVFTQNVVLTYGESYTMPLGWNPDLMTRTFKYLDDNGEYKPYTGGGEPRNVGSYLISVTPNAPKTWAGGGDEEVSAAYTIKALTIDTLKWYIDGAEDLSILYDGNSHAVYATFEDPFEQFGTHALFVDGSFSDAFKDANSYTVSVSLPAYDPILQNDWVYNFNLSENANSEITFEITPQEVEISWNVEEGYQYLHEDNVPRSPTPYITGNMSAEDLQRLLTYTVKVYQKDQYPGTDLPGGAIEVGNYIIVVELTNDGSKGNFIFASGYYQGNKFLAALEFEIIEKLLIYVHWENVQDWTYDGFDHTPTAYYTTNIDSIQYPLTVTLNMDGAPDTVEYAINAGNYTASVDVLSQLTAELLQKLNQTFGIIYGNDGETPVYEVKGADDTEGDGVDEVEFKITKLEVTLGWLNDHETFAYDGKSHSPVAYYTYKGMAIILKLTIVGESSGEVTQAIEPDKYTATITDSRIENYDIGDEPTFKVFSIVRQRGTITVTVSWTGTNSYTYNGEPQAPVAVLEVLSGEVEATSVSVYMTAAGTVLDGAPVNVGSYKVTTTFYDEENEVLAETSYEFYILKMKVAKPLVERGVFATMAEAKAYAPSNYAAEYMVYSGEEGDGVYVMTISLRNGNYEWLDGTTDAESYTLKISPDLSATVVGPDGVTYLTVATEAMSKKTLYIIIGGIAVVALVAMIALIAALSRRKVIVNGSDDDEGFYEDYE